MWNVPLSLQSTFDCFFFVWPKSVFVFHLKPKWVEMPKNDKWKCSRMSPERREHNIALLSHKWTSKPEKRLKTLSTLHKTNSFWKLRSSKYWLRGCCITIIWCDRKPLLSLSKRGFMERLECEVVHTTKNCWKSRFVPFVLLLLRALTWWWSTSTLGTTFNTNDLFIRWPYGLWCLNRLNVFKGLFWERYFVIVI